MGPPRPSRIVHGSDSASGCDRSKSWAGNAGDIWQTLGKDRQYGMDRLAWSSYCRQLESEAEALRGMEVAPQRSVWDDAAVEAEQLGTFLSAHALWLLHEAVSFSLLHLQGGDNSGL